MNTWRPWRLLADDLTGALDSAAAFAGPTAVAVGWDDKVPDGRRAAAASTDTRDAAPDVLARRLAGALPWLAGGRAFKKIDSLVRGNTITEVAWLARCGAFERVVLAPAFPAQRRWTRGGLHRAEGWACELSLLDVLRAQGLDAACGPQPTDASVWVPDIEGDHDLAALAARPTGRHWLWCGSAGLAWALARQAGQAPTAAAWPRAAGPPLLVSASRHPVFRSQLAALEPALAAPKFTDLAPTVPLQGTTAASHVAEQAAQLLALPAPALLVVIGGDTLLALCRASGASALAAEAAPRPGWGRARFVGGRWDGLTLLSRSGAFGAPDDLITLFSSLTCCSESPA